MAPFIDAKAFQQFSIVEFLVRLGHHPVRKTGKEHFYHSMIRETAKKTPSFSVYDAGGKWIDRGDASGKSKGGILQLAMAYWPDCSYYQVLQNLSKICGMDAHFLKESQPGKMSLTKKTTDVSPAFCLVSVAEPGGNELLSTYLKSRGLLDIAGGRLKEVYFRTKDYKGFKSLSAVGWPNENGGWEFVRPNGFKSTIGAKGITVIPGDLCSAAVFEGFLDYLSALVLQRVAPEVSPTVFVLNSISMLDRIMEKLQTFDFVNAYFDNDAPGRRTFETLKMALPWAMDRSVNYKGFKDFNEKLVALNERNDSLTHDQEHWPTRGTRR